MNSRHLISTIRLHLISLALPMDSVDTYEDESQFKNNNDEENTILDSKELPGLNVEFISGGLVVHHQQGVHLHQA